MNLVGSKFQVAPLCMRGFSLITYHLSPITTRSVPMFGGSAPFTKDKGNPLWLHLGFKNAYPVSIWASGICLGQTLSRKISICVAGFFLSIRCFVLIYIICDCFASWYISFFLTKYFVLYSLISLIFKIYILSFHFCYY